MAMHIALRAERPVEVWALVLSALSGVAGCAPGADTAPGSRQAAILDGALDAADESVVYLTFGDYDCTGSVIADRFVLTAKHCMMDDTETAWLDLAVAQVFSGPNPSGGDGTILADAGEVSRMHLFDDSTTIDHVDIALLETSVGYGQYGDAEWQWDGAKRRGSGSVLANDGTEIYATAATCYGDSGGPTFDATETIVGVNSSGTEDLCSSGEDVFTNVGHFAGWIDAILGAQGEAPDPNDEADPNGEPDPRDEPTPDDDAPDPLDDPAQDPSLGVLGDWCSRGSDCASLTCAQPESASAYCTEPCGTGCPEGFECRRLPAGDFCWLAEDVPEASPSGTSGSCGVSGPGSDASLAAALALGAPFVLTRRSARRRRGSKSERLGGPRR